MQSLGDKVRREREVRNATIEEISAATGIDRGYLEALEKNEFQALPGPAFGKLYIRAYAETLGFDPRSLLEAYDREQRAGQPASETLGLVPIRERPVETEIARWRETMLAKRGRPRPPAPTVERGEAAVEDATDDDPQAGEVLENEGAPTPELSVPSPDGTPIEGATSTAGTPWSVRRIVLALLFFGLVIGVAGTYILVSRTGDEATAPTVARATETIPREDPRPAEPKEEPRSARATEPAASPPAKVSPVIEMSPSRLSAPEFGVGRRIVERRLEGQDERFAPGEVVWFSTRVVGGKRGEFIRHVWLLEGRVKQSIRLRLGGADWRTHSNRTVGETGEWTAEARDERGRVLARATFTCASRDAVDDPR